MLHTSMLHTFTLLTLRYIIPCYIHLVVWSNSGYYFIYWNLSILRFLQTSTQTFPSIYCLCVTVSPCPELELYPTKWAGHTGTYPEICMVRVLRCGGQMMFIWRSRGIAKDVGVKTPGTPQQFEQWPLGFNNITRPLFYCPVIGLSLFL